MTLARIKLIVAALALIAWLTWLAIAVANKGTVQIISTAQLTDATHLIVATVTTNDSGDAELKVKVIKVIRAPDADPIGDEIEISRLDKAVTPLPINGSRRIAAGDYFIPLIKTPFGIKIAGLPRSPGFEGATLEQPIVYPWTPDVQTQLRSFGILKD